MKSSSVLCIAAVLLGTASMTIAAPMTVGGAPFTLVATGPGTTQLFGLTSDAQGRIYTGNNSNSNPGIPVQLFDPALFSGSPISLQNFGPAVRDADGLTFGAGSIYSADQDAGVRKTSIPGGSSSVFIPASSFSFPYSAGVNPTGSPMVFRPSDDHLFVGFGASAGAGAPGQNRIDEYDASGNLVHTFSTVAETETMTFDAHSGLIYYANFSFSGPSAVRAFNPVAGTDTLVGFSSGSIDGALAFDPISGLLFLGAANGVNPGFVETMNPSTGLTTPFATGFDDSLGILREPVTGDLYFLESNQLFRLESAKVPEPAALGLFAIGIVGLSVHTRWGRKRAGSAAAPVSRQLRFSDEMTQLLQSRVSVSNRYR
jgi:hypothetical protein